jgi:hypothetical protein
MRARSGCLSSVMLSLGLTVGCGESTKDSPSTAGMGGADAATAGKGASTAGGGASGSSGGKPSAGSAGQAFGGQGGKGGEPPNGAPTLVDCDPSQVVCKIATPTCPAGQVPSVEGTCYGACVKIERCACTAADQCPDSNQYTCWVGPKHCGPYVR